MQILDKDWEMWYYLDNAININYLLNLEEKMNIKLRATNRRFLRGEFNDQFGHSYSIQESSLDTGEPTIWLGADDVIVYKNDVPTKLPPGYQVAARMHLTQKMVSTLLPHLQRFVEKGNLEE